jgi:hypothetical protein
MTATIDGTAASVGTIYYVLPGVPVNVRIETPGVVLVEKPSGQTGWNHLAFRSNVRRHMVVIIDWERTR